MSNHSFDRKIGLFHLGGIGFPKCRCCVPFKGRNGKKLHSRLAKKRLNRFWNQQISEQLLK